MCGTVMHNDKLISTNCLDRCTPAFCLQNEVIISSFKLQKAPIDQDLKPYHRRRCRRQIIYLEINIFQKFLA